MAISKEAYKALEDIVGPDNISDEPATLDSYAFQAWAELRKNGEPFLPRPLAAILPGSVEDVQAIVRVCNKFKIRFKAYSTGWQIQGGSLMPDWIQIDLRRMDRILEIDEKNNFAVIEPYVIGAQLQAEAMKVGLNTHIIGAGSVCSPLAAATSFYGIGPDSLFMGMSHENLLGVEWVMPNGEILRTGSLGSGCGWFCGDGPGPSLAGVFRGPIGAAGGLGVFTKVAIKLFPWPGPRVLPIEGKIPVYQAVLPKVIKGHTITWSSWEGFRDALYKIFDNDIGYIAHRQYILWGDELQGATIQIVTDPDRTIDDIENILKDPKSKKLSEELYRSFQIVLVGMTERDIDFQEKLLDTILAETGGWKVQFFEKPEVANWSLLYMLRLCFKGMNWLYRGSYCDHMLRAGTPEVMVSGAMEQMKQGQDEFAKRTHLIVDHGGDAAMGGMGGIGGGGYPGFENFGFYDPADPESVKAARELGDEGGYRAAQVVSGGYSIFYMEDDEVKKGIMEVANPYIWRYQRKIKEGLDPNEVGAGGYFYLDEASIEEAVKKSEERKKASQSKKSGK